MNFLADKEFQTFNISSVSSKLVGVVSGTTSLVTIPISSLLNIFKIPVVAATASSQMLSDKVKFKYFLRVIPSDRYQAQALVDIMIHFNWTYVSAINSPDTYGRTGMETLKGIAAEAGICIAYSHQMMSKATQPEEYKEVAKQLIRHKNARVIVLFGFAVDAKGIMDALEYEGEIGHFIWITSDGVLASELLAEYGKMVAGGFHVQLYSTVDSGFQEYFQTLSPASSNNPWLKQLWQQEFNCSEQTPDECDWTKTFQEFPDYAPEYTASLVIDSVLTFAHAIHNLISDQCPEAFDDKQLLPGCVQGENLLPYLFNVTFDGSYGLIRFDQNGDAEGKYRIDQNQFTGKEYEVVEVGQWDKATQSLAFFEDLYWNLDPDYDVPNSDLPKIPDSLCSRPCEPGEFYVQQELKCCWDCRKCRDNEIVVSNGTSCYPCDELTWPDHMTFTDCVDIPPSYLVWGDTRVVLCLVLAMLGLGSCMIILFIYVKFKNAKLIKATSLGLSLIALIGIMLAYITAVFIISKPSTALCYLSRLGFNISFAIVYGPLLAKTSRIYRIFAAAKHGTKPPTFISAHSQMIFSTTLIMLQVSGPSLTYCLYFTMSQRGTTIIDYQLTHLFYCKLHVTSK